MEIRPFVAGDLEAVVRVWHEARRAAYEFLPAEQARSLDEDRAFFVSRIAPRHALQVATEGTAPGGRCASARARPPSGEPDVEDHWRPPAY
jgi:hypothetical protein